MNRKGHWLAAAALAALLAVSPGARAGVRAEAWYGPPPYRHKVVVVHPGHVHVAVYRGWNHARYVYMPGRWVPGGPHYYYVHGRHYHGHYHRPHGEAYGH